MYHDDDGMVVLRGRLEPEAGALVVKALAAARETLFRRNQSDAAGQTAGEPLPPSVSRDEVPTLVQQQADALALLAEVALHHGPDPGAPGERYQVIVHVDALTLAGTDRVEPGEIMPGQIEPGHVELDRVEPGRIEPDQPGQAVLEDGAHVSAETSRRLACDASRVIMHDAADGRFLAVGARTRTIPPAVRRALQHRDRGCRFPGCEVRFGQGHHLRHWAHGGPTTLANLALLYRRHHRAVHEEGFRVGRDPDGALWFRQPDGRPLPDVPPPASVSEEPVQVFLARHAADGLQVDAWTGCAGWLGERLDVGWALDVLHPLAGPPAGD